METLLSGKADVPGSGLIGSFCPVFDLMLLPHCKIQYHADKGEEDDHQNPDQLVVACKLVFQDINECNQRKQQKYQQKKEYQYNFCGSRNVKQ
jgi:hypothetical protein